MESTGRGGLLAPVLALAVAAGAAAPAQAAWTPARATEHRTAPRAATALESGELAMWAGKGSVSQRLTWPAGAAGPVSSGVPAPRLHTDQPWRVNARGDVLVLDEPEGEVQAAVVEASGARDSFTATAPRGREVGTLTGAIGPDGTAVVAWVYARESFWGGLNIFDPDDYDPDSTVWVRVREPGGQFGRPTAVPADGPVGDVELGVAPDGRVEMAYAYVERRNEIFMHTEFRPGSAPGPGTRVAARSRGGYWPYVHGIIAGGPGVSRVVLAAGRGSTGRARATALLRTGQDEWASRQLLEAGTTNMPGRLHALPDGRVVFAYHRSEGERRQSAADRDVRVRTAAPGAPLGPATVAGRMPRGWLAGPPAVASNARGDLMLAWDEASLAFCGDESCFGRVVAASWPAGAAGFGPVRVLSPLGTVLDWSLPVVALSNDGRRLVGWRAAPTSAVGPRALWTATGDDGPDIGIPGGDARAPRVSFTPSRRALRDAARTGRLRLRLRCNEACAARPWISHPASERWITGLRAVVLRPGRTTTVTWRLSRGERRGLGRSMKRGKVFVGVRATDSAGNLSRVRKAAR
jgi:hypothetical protein